MGRTNVWLAVTADRFELPRYVADSATKLGWLVNRSAPDIRRAKSRGNVARSGPLKGCRVICVEIEEDDGDADVFDSTQADLE